MKALRFHVIGMAMAVAALAGPAAAAEPMTVQDYMALSGPAPTAHIAYGPAPQQYVELFEPAGPGPFPVAVLIHGGCFQSRYQGMPQMRGMAGALAARGVAVWSVEYRGLDVAGGGYPGTFADVAAAVDLLGVEAKGRHIDTRRLVAVGHSAGAILALWLAGRARLPASSPLHAAHPLPVRRVIALGGTGDLRPGVQSLTVNCGIDAAQLTGVASVARPDIYADTTAIDLTPNGARVLLINGDLDSITPPKEAADYAARVRARGDVAEAAVFPRASHYDEVAVTSPAWALVGRAILSAVGR